MWVLPHCQEKWPRAERHGLEGEQVEGLLILQSSKEGAPVEGAGGRLLQGYTHDCPA